MIKENGRFKPFWELVFWLVLMAFIVVGSVATFQLSVIPAMAEVASISVARGPLRCTNGDPPRVWTRVDAESQLHYARVALDTARQYGGSMPYKQAWAMEALATMELVKLCWGVW